MFITNDQILKISKCKAIVDAKGADSKYARDCACRELMDAKLSDLYSFLNIPPDQNELIIQAGIGTLIIRETGNEWTPAPTLKSMFLGVSVAVSENVAALVRGEPLKAPQNVIDERMRLCNACPFWNAKAEICNACGCGTTKQKLANSSCPKNFWKAVDAQMEQTIP